MTSTPTQPRQRRSRQTLTRILTVAEDLFEERGEQGFTIAELADRAGTSVGTVYRRFATKEDILLAVLDRLHEQQEAETLAGWAAEDWSRLDNHAMVSVLVQSLARMWRQHGPLLRAVMARRLQQREDALFRSALAATRHRSAMFQAVLLTRRSAILHPDPESATDFTFRLIESMCARWTAGSAESRTPYELGWDSMLNHLCDTAVAYLFGLSPQGGSTCTAN